MPRSSFLAAVILCCTYSQCAIAADAPQVLAAGDWSKPVADSRGYAVRGRLVICEKPRDDKLREVVVYVELQEASNFIGADLQLYCEMAKRDFRPEYKGGLQCELHDADDKPVKTQSFPFGGAVPKSQWVTLPTDATIRLRTTPFGIRREGELAICPDLGKLWVIGRDDRQEYRLSGTFTVDPDKDLAKPMKEHVWRGTIELPPVKVVNAPK